jgi:hypothetical protein
MKRTSVEVKLGIPVVGQVSGTWVPDEAERWAAWELYVELVTRITVVDLPPDQGLLREALSSLHSLFPTTRDILRRYGPAVAPQGKEGGITFGYLAVAILNGVLRPLLSTWHPALSAHEATRSANRLPAEHERLWDRANELRNELVETRQILVEFAEVLGEVAGAASLLPAAEHQVLPRHR